MNNIKETDSHEEKGDVPGEKRCVTTQPLLLVLQNTQLHCLRDRVIVILFFMSIVSQPIL